MVRESPGTGPSTSKVSNLASTIGSLNASSIPQFWFSNPTRNSVVSEPGLSLPKLRQCKIVTSWEGGG